MNKAEVLFDKIASITSSAFIPQHLLENGNDPTASDMVQYRNYLQTKAAEEPSSSLLATSFGVLGGGLLGGALGTGLGAVVKNPKLGGGIGAGLGALAGGTLGYLLKLVDQDRIEEAKMVLASTDISDAEKRQLAVEMRRWQEITYAKNRIKNSKGIGTGLFQG